MQELMSWINVICHHAFPVINTVTVYWRCSNRMGDFILWVMTQCRAHHVPCCPAVSVSVVWSTCLPVLSESAQQDHLASLNSQEWAIVLMLAAHLFGKPWITERAAEPGCAHQILVQWHACSLQVMHSVRRRLAAVVWAHTELQGNYFWGEANCSSLV